MDLLYSSASQFCFIVKKPCMPVLFQLLLLLFNWQLTVLLDMS